VFRSRASLTLAPLIVGAAIAFGLLGEAVPAEAQFVSQVTHPRHILEGHWQSCQETAGGLYAERVYDHVVNGVGQFEVHLGPRHEFAMFVGVEDEHREHARLDNLLKPHRLGLRGVPAGHRWEVPSLGLVFSVTRGGGDRTDCANWFVLLEPLDRTSD
jgi:hypothetical protein